MRQIQIVYGYKRRSRTFLSQFNQKVKVFGLVFRDDRGKSLQTLLELEITPKYREDIIMQLDANDYVDGPIKNTLNKKGEMWVFGKDVKSRDVYILKYQWESVIQVQFAYLFI